MSKHKELPQVLVLKRAYIQRFPNGQQVALYHSDALNQFVTVPLDDSQFSNTTESFIDQLTQISENDATETLRFDDASELNINKECADIILNFITSNEEISEHLSISDKSFLEVLEQAVQIDKLDSVEEFEQQELTQ